MEVYLFLCGYEYCRQNSTLWKNTYVVVCIRFFSSSISHCVEIYILRDNIHLWMFLLSWVNTRFLGHQTNSFLQLLCSLILEQILLKLNISLVLWPMVVNFWALFDHFWKFLLKILVNWPVKEVKQEDQPDTTQKGRLWVNARNVDARIWNSNLAMGATV